VEKNIVELTGDSMSIVAGDEAVRELMKPILGLLSEEENLTELVINKPKWVSIETDKGWREIKVEELTKEKLNTIASTIAAYNEQSITGEKPIISAILPDDERVQVVIPPAVPNANISITIRKPSSTI